MRIVNRKLPQKRPVIALGLALASTLGWCPRALALDPALDVSQYAHTAWRIRDGFSKGAITSIAQTPDGYLWLGTEFGLLRFDGVRNVPWQPPADQRLPSNEIFSLLVARDGTLWIGTSKGLASWKDGKLVQYAELADRYIYKVLEDREGVIWASGLRITAGRLCAIRNARVNCYGDDGSLGRGAFNLYEDSKGNLWAGVATGLWRWKPGPPKFYPLPGEPDGIQGLGEDVDGTLLVGWRGGIHRFVDGKTEVYSLPGVVGQFRTKRLLRDRDGGLWIGTSSKSLLHAHKGRADVFAPPDGLTAESIMTLFEDREGTIWVATTNGLDRFRDLAVATFSTKQGLLNSVVGSVLAAKDGSAWIATLGGLNRWNNRQITTPSTGSGKRDGKLNGHNPNSLFEDDSGRIWVSTPFGFGYLENDRFVSVSSVPGGVTGIAQDTAGDLWIAHQRAGLFQLRRGKVVQQVPWGSLGRKDTVSALAGDPSQGGVWLGFFSGGIAHFRDGQIRASYAAPEGLPDGRVSDLRLDQEGALWVATERGLGRLKNGRIATLASKGGLPCDAVHWMLEDDDHAVWLETGCGLVRIARPELDAWITGSDEGQEMKRKIQTTVFDSSDGVRVRAFVGSVKPLAAKSKDGRVWLAGDGGANVFDPRRLPFNKLPPPVHVEQITADRQRFDVASAGNEQLRLPALLRDVQIDYTALSLVAPEKVRFRYKLEGWDRDWQDAGSRRQAFYNNLPPRNYRFRVIACNNSGLWNEAGAFLDFTIAPAYYQTVWFRVSLAAGFLGLLAALYQLRLRQATQQVRLRMEGRHEERERIARELHDTLLQSVQGLILKFDAVAKQIPGDEPARQAIEKTLDHADQILAEGRDRVRNMRATAASFSDLPTAFQQVAAETPKSGDANFKTIVEGRSREINPTVLEECYSIGREALVNALIHSGGQHVEVEVTYDPKQFRLRIRDDGRGVDSKVLDDGGRTGHWGLRGMRERADKIGAQLQLWSRAGTGTEVELTVPAAIAYRGSRVEPKGSWFRQPSDVN